MNSPVSSLVPPSTNFPTLYPTREKSPMARSLLLSFLFLTVFSGRILLTGVIGAPIPEVMGPLGLPDITADPSPGKGQDKVADPWNSLLDDDDEDRPTRHRRPHHHDVIGTAAQLAGDVVRADINLKKSIAEHALNVAGDVVNSVGSIASDVADSASSVAGLNSLEKFLKNFDKLPPKFITALKSFINNILSDPKDKKDGKEGNEKAGKDDKKDDRKEKNVGKGSKEEGEKNGENGKEKGDGSSH